MKKLIHKSTWPVAVAISMPLLMLGGCAGNDTVKLTPDSSIAENEIIEQTNITNDQQIEIEATSVDSAAEPMGEENIQLVEPVESQVTEVAVVEGKTPKPEEEIIGFGFDKSDIDSAYGELLWQHAQYLIENKNLVLHINGHTDNSGARVYNEMLSKKRANQVAKILGEFGAPENRIKVTGNAGDQPLAGAIHHREHRRVELDYQDQQIVSN